jgi:glycine/D-amino acid oxidase-like deaminating enzyme
MKEYSYWLDTINKDFLKENDLPKKTDVLIVGFGYTGLNAAIEIAKNGRSVCVIDKNDFGCGCSSKNGGQISNLLKPSLKKLTKKYGFQKAKSIRGEGVNAVEWLIDFIKTENFDCDFKREGRFHGAHTPIEFKKMVSESNDLKEHEGIETQIIPKSDQKNEINSDLYHGGVVFPQHASLNAAKYHKELIEKAFELGVHVISSCEMVDFKKRLDEFSVLTNKGPLKTKNLIVATNGYTSNVTPWLNNRNIPIGSYVIATEELPKDYISNLFPTNRHITDTCRVVYYFRPSPDRKRIIFGGRVSSREISLSKSAPLLLKDLKRVFPDLPELKISHSWMGYVSYTFDNSPHIGFEDGLYYSMGYCGSGIALSSYLGMKLGKKVIGDNEGATAFDSLKFPTRPFYNGRPWFLPAVVELYKFRDSREMIKYMN